MGKQDLLAKKYMSDNEKFADVFNYYYTMESRL